MAIPNTEYHLVVIPAQTHLQGKNMHTHPTETHNLYQSYSSTWKLIFQTNPLNLAAEVVILKNPLLNW